MNKETKYTIELTEKQARLLSSAMDSFARLIIGQDWEYQQLMENAWFKRCKEATGNMLDDKFEDGWQAMRDDAERICKEIKLRFWGMPGNATYGVKYDDTADILFDMHQVIRHQLWLDDDEKTGRNGIVDAAPAHQFGSEPLIKIRKIFEDKIDFPRKARVINEERLLHNCEVTIFSSHLVYLDYDNESYTKEELEFL